MAGNYVGTAYVHIVPSTKGFIKDLSKTSKESGKESGETWGKSFQEILASSTNGIAGKVGQIAGKAVKATAAAVAVGATAAVGAVGMITKASLDAYATNEQLIGGVETLFGTNGKSIEEYAASVGKSVSEVSGKYSQLEQAQQLVVNNARSAFKTAGVSANQYMEQVTSFSASLVSSLGGDTLKAAKVADTAVTDMADNANKMGTAIGSIQDAYQGFAKQNYTMLDNLKLGYGGTKSEMERLISDANRVRAANGEMATLSIDSFADVVEAIHTIQDEMGITGTTAQEAASTIEGSINMTKASWENFLTSLGSGDSAQVSAAVDDLVDSAVTALGNIIPRAGIIVKQLIEAAPGAISTLKSAIEENLLPVLDEMTGGAATRIWEGLQPVIEKFQEFGEALAPVIEAALPVISSALGLLADTVLPALSGALTFISENMGIVVPLVVAFGVAALGLAAIGPITTILGAFGVGVSAATAPVTLAVPQILALAVAALALGAGVLLAAAGVTLLVNAAISLVAAGPVAAVALVALVAVIAGLALGFAALAGPLTLAAPGMFAFGVAAALVGAGVMLACAGLTMLAPSLSTIGANGVSAAVGIAAVSAACVALAASGALCAVGIAALALACVAATVGIVALGAGLALSAAAMALLAASSALAGVAFTVMAVPATMVAAALPLIAASAALASPALALLAASVALAGGALLLAVPGVSGFALAASPAATSAVKLANSTSKINSTASSAANGLSRMRTSASSMSSAANSAATSIDRVSTSSQKLSTATSATVSPMSTSRNAMTQTAQASTLLANAVIVAATRVQTGCNSMASGFSRVVTQARTAASQISSAFSGMRMHIPSPTLGPLPHFSMSGKFDPQTGSVPSISVSWYARGGVFANPSIIGVGDASTPEIVTPEALMRSVMRDALADHSRRTPAQVTQNFNAKIVRADSDLDSAAQLFFRAGMSAAAEVF